MIEYVPLPEKDRLQIIKDESRWLHERHLEFAVAVQEATEWGMHALINESGGIGHVYLSTPNDRLFDARGYFEEKDATTPFDGQCTAESKPIELTDLLGQIDESLLPDAREFVAFAWMDICKNDFLEEHSWARNCLRFAKELDKLCRKHEVHIKPSSNVCRILVYKRLGGDRGFQISQGPGQQTNYMNRMEMS